MVECDLMAKEYHPTWEQFENMAEYVRFVERDSFDKFALCKVSFLFCFYHKRFIQRLIETLCALVFKII